jgi:predicted anti-sigma-YlaC factor YlaD
MTSYIDDISHAHLCERCRRWGPEEANFCGRCGFQLRPIPFPVAPTVAAQARRRRRRRRLLAMDNAGWAGLVGTLIGERIHDSRTAERKKGEER